MRIRNLFIAFATIAVGVAFSLGARATDDRVAPPISPIVTPLVTPSVTQAPIATGHLYDRIAVVGASASDGFGVSVREDAPAIDSNPPVIKRTPTRLNLADVLRYAARPSTIDGASAMTTIIHHYASGFFFANPGPVGRSEIDRSLAINPTLVLGLDFLFWYVYGTVTADGKPMVTAPDRLANLDAGLAQLDRLVSAGIPLVIADIPDMHDAIGKMLSESQVPEVDALAPINARIAQWVKARPTVTIMPLSHILTALKSGGVIELAGRTWDPAELGELLQNDQLHPTFAGTVIIAAGLIDLARTNDASLTPPFEFKPKAIRERALAKSAAKKDSKPESPATAGSTTVR